MIDHQISKPILVASAIAVKNAIEANPLSREHPLQLVPDLSVEAKQLLPVFKLETGLTFIGYQRKIRLEFASELLLKGENVKGVAIACNYKGDYALSNFSKDFNVVFGLRPKKWLQQKMNVDITDTPDPT